VKEDQHKKKEYTMISKKVLSILLLSCTIALTLAACGDTGTGNSAGSGNTVHMNNADFLQPSITIHKGESITLVADTGVPHRIANGAWENGTAQAAKEAGAPQVNNVQIDGNSSQTIGPFNTAGTFHLYCTIHPGMNLTIIVQ